MDDEISKAEIGKDAAQNALDAAAETVGTVTTIVVRAVRDIAKAVGDLGTELFEIGEAARRASSDEEK
jgi:hypothetical protein